MIGYKRTPGGAQGRYPSILHGHRGPGEIGKGRDRSVETAFVRALLPALCGEWMKGVDTCQISNTYNGGEAVAATDMPMFGG